MDKSVLSPTNMSDASTIKSLPVACTGKDNDDILEVKTLHKGKGTCVHVNLTWESDHSDRIAHMSIVGYLLPGQWVHTYFTIMLCIRLNAE